MCWLENVIVQKNGEIGASTKKLTQILKFGENKLKNILVIVDVLNIYQRYKVDLWNIVNAWRIHFYSFNFRIGLCITYQRQAADFSEWTINKLIVGLTM